MENTMFTRLFTSLTRLSLVRLVIQDAYRTEKSSLLCYSIALSRAYKSFHTSCEWVCREVWLLIWQRRGRNYISSSGGMAVDPLLFIKEFQHIAMLQHSIEQPINAIISKLLCFPPPLCYSIAVEVPNFLINDINDVCDINGVCFVLFPPFRRHYKRRGFFLMERTTCPEILASRLKLDIRTDKFNNIQPVFNFLDGRSYHQLYSN